ncbi:MAG: mannonate dehydratase [Bacteroidia bacterium]|nr:mannonate dehydratase [Bacteroidia bacterium]
MQHAWRWYGPKDPVSLDDIRQAGATAIVNALHENPIGELWTREDILKRKNLIEGENDQKAPLYWKVVESVPVHESIKQGLPDRDHWIANYQQTLRNLGAEGIGTVCYNFMPVVDWTRTSLTRRLANGALALDFDLAAFAYFDIHILQREGAEADYDLATLERMTTLAPTANSSYGQELMRIIVAGLPGGQEGYSFDAFKERLAAYREIDQGGYKENLRYFLEAVVPVAAEAGVKLAIHPDDPPYPLFGLPRILSTEADLAEMLGMVDNEANGFTLCTGSFGAEKANDLSGMVYRHGSRLHFIHLRNVAFFEDRSFFESEHLVGHADMYAIVEAIVKEEAKRGVLGSASAIPMRPDHGHQMLDDLRKHTNPGYSAIGRLKGLAELRGLEVAILRQLGSS